MTVKSFTSKVVGEFVEEGLKRFKGLSERDMAGVIFWLETKQMELRMQLDAEDDALAAAKLRGGIEHLGYAATEALQLVQERVAEAASEPGEQEER